MTDETESHIGRIEEEILELEDRIADLRAYLGHLKAGGTPGDWGPLPAGWEPPVEDQEREIVIEPMVCGDFYWEVVIPVYSEGEGRRRICALIPHRGRTNTRELAERQAAEAAKTEIKR